MYVLPPKRGFQLFPRDLVRRLAVVCRWPSYSCSLFTVHCTVSSVQCPVSSVLCPVSCVQCPVSSVLCPVSCVQCALVTGHCPLPCVQCLLGTTVHGSLVSTIQHSLVAHVQCPVSSLVWTVLVLCSAGGHPVSTAFLWVVLHCPHATQTLSAVCSVQCAVCSVQCAVSSMQYAVSSMQCTPKMSSIECAVLPGGVQCSYCYRVSSLLRCRRSYEQLLGCCLQCVVCSV